VTTTDVLLRLLLLLSLLFWRLLLGGALQQHLLLSHALHPNGSRSKPTNRKSPNACACAGRVLYKSTRVPLSSHCGRIYWYVLLQQKHSTITHKTMKFWPFHQATSGCANILATSSSERNSGSFTTWA
jgi:hypothetical protein